MTDADTVHFCLPHLSRAAFRLPGPDDVHLMPYLEHYRMRHDEPVTNSPDATASHFSSLSSAKELNKMCPVCCGSYFDYASGDWSFFLPSVLDFI